MSQDEKTQFDAEAQPIDEIDTLMQKAYFAVAKTFPLHPDVLKAQELITEAREKYRESRSV